MERLEQGDMDVPVAYFTSVPSNRINRKRLTNKLHGLMVERGNTVGFFASPVSSLKTANSPLQNPLAL